MKKEKISKQEEKEGMNRNLIRTKNKRKTEQRTKRKKSRALYFRTFDHTAHFTA